MSARRPPLMLYCQHSLGMGHLVRSLALAGALTSRFRVVLLSGGRIPNGLRIPERVEIVALPPLGIGGDGRLVSLDRRRSTERALAERARRILETFRSLHPKVLLIELFPFGRRKFTGELVPLLDEARSAGPLRPLVLCSLRDILVDRGHRQAAHDRRAAELVQDYFDAILVHADPRFARFEESFRQASRLGIPVLYTGFIHARSARRPPAARSDIGRKTATSERVVVSAGGGLVGEPLFRAAIEAHVLLPAAERRPMTIVTGPFLSEPAARLLRRLARGQESLRLVRWVPDLCTELRRSAASVSQCGYNTSLDLIASGVRSLVVPFSDGGENEQMNRARRLERLGMLRVLDPERLTGPALASEIRALFRFQPRRIRLDLAGASRSAEIVQDLLDGGGTDRSLGEPWSRIR